MTSVFLKNALAYTSVNLFAQVAQLAQRFLVRSVISPAQMGVWELALAIQGFVASIDPGLSSAAWFELPVLHGQRELQEEERVRSTTFWSNLVLGLLGAGGILIYTCVRWSKFSDDMALAPLVAAFLVVIFAINQSFVTFYQARQSYIQLSRISFCYAVCFAAACSLGAFTIGLVGLLAGAVLAYGLQTTLFLFLAGKEGLLPSRSWKPATFRRLLAFGLPLRLADFPMALFCYMDVFLITSFLDAASLGIYATARVFFLQTANVSAMLGNVFGARILHMSGAGRMRAELAADMRDFLIIQYLLLYPVLTGAVLLGFSFLTTLMNPQYTGSIPVLKVLILCTFFAPQAAVVRNFWMMDKRLLALGISSVVGLAAMAASLFCFTRILGVTLESVAWAALVGYLLYYLYLMFSIGRELWGISGSVRVAGCAVLAASLIWFSVAVLPDRLDWKDSDLGLQLATFFLRFGLSMALTIPLALWSTRLREHLNRLRARRAEK